MFRGEMCTLGRDSCDFIIVSADAYVTHPSFGMAVIGRVVEAHGFRIGIIAQPDWITTAGFMKPGRPNLRSGVTGGNMDSMVNRSIPPTGKSVPTMPATSGAVGSRVFAPRRYSVLCMRQALGTWSDGVCRPPCCWVGGCRACHRQYRVPAAGRPPLGCPGALNSPPTANQAPPINSVSIAERAVTNFSMLRYAYAETSGLQNTNKLFFHARHIRQLSRKTAYEGFIQAGGNKFAKPSFRGLLGARLTLSEKPGVNSMHLGLGGFCPRETLEDRAGAGP
jgi:Radical SAM N-terminal